MAKRKAKSKAKSRQPRRSQPTRRNQGIAVKPELVAAIDRDLAIIKDGYSLSFDAAERTAMLQRHHVAMVKAYGEFAPPSPITPADVAETLAYLTMLRRFLVPPDWQANPHRAQHGQAAYQRYCAAATTFDLKAIAAAAKTLAAVLRDECPILGQRFPFSRRDSRIRSALAQAAGSLRRHLDFTGQMPAKMALHINDINRPGHPQREAVRPLYKLWNVLQEKLLLPLAESPDEIPVVEQDTIDAIERAAEKLSPSPKGANDNFLPPAVEEHRNDLVPGHLGLVVDDANHTVTKPGLQPVEFGSKQKPWEVFLYLFESGTRHRDLDEIDAEIWGDSPHTPNAVQKAISTANKLLAPLGVEMHGESGPRYFLKML